MAQNDSWFRRLFGDEIINCSGKSKSVRDNFDVQPIEKMISSDREERNSGSDNPFHRVVGVYFTNFPFVTGTTHDAYQVFTAKLVEFYTRINSNSAESRHKKFEVVQVFVPHTLQQCSEYTSEGKCDREQLKDVLLDVPWFALPMQDEIRRVRLKHRFKAKDGAVVLLSAETGRVLCKNCRERIEEDPEGVHFPWLSRPVPHILQKAGQGGLLLGGLRCGRRKRKVKF